MITKKRTKHGFAVIILTILLLLATLSFSFADGNVSTVPEGAAGSGTIYVAGQPDNYPVEFYNEETKSFEGIFPQILEKVSAETGLSFTYLNGGKGDLRDRMNRNCQCEIVSCVANNEIDLIDELASTSDILFTLEDGRSYCLGYTSIANDGMIQSVNKSLKHINGSELLNYSVNSAGRIRTFTGYRTIIISAVLGIIVLILVLLVARAARIARRENKRKSEARLLDKASFDKEYSASITEDTRSVYSLVYLGFDVDSVNHSYGSNVVDRQLKFAESELTKLLDGSDIACRDGGHFVIAGVHGGKENVDAWIHGILNEINGSENEADKMNFHAGIYMLSGKMGSSEDDVISNARQAFFAALNENRLIQFCTPELMQKIKQRHKLAEDAARGLEKGEFKLYLQLTLRAKDKAIVGAEALTRWDHPSEGLLHPIRYIEALSESGLIRKLDLYIFERCCEQLETWQAKGLYGYISCNFTRNTIDNESFVNELLEKANAYDFDRSKLVMEITEESIVSNQAQALENIIHCKEAGFSIALDDVGSGSTSFADLREYPIDMMKIDRSILLGSDSERGKALLKGMIVLAKSMDMVSLCEGIETDEQYQLLKSLGCDYVQGFLFYHAMPVDIVNGMFETK